MASSNASPHREPSEAGLGALIRDVRVLRLIAQFSVLGVVILVFGWLIANTQQGLERASIPTDFGFLSQPSGFQIDEGLSFQPHKRTDSYANAFLTGVINTLRAVIVSLVLCTILGVVVGIMRLSTNWLVRMIAIVYIEIFQNTPLLLQLFFIFTSVILTLPPAATPIVVLDGIYLSSGGLAMPALVAQQNGWLWFAFSVIAFVLAVIIWRQLKRRRLESGRATYAAEISSALFFGVTLISLFVLQPFSTDYPEIGRFGYVLGKGAVLSAPFFAIVIGLVLYTGAFIAEIVRSGIQAVPYGQWEAARSQGFRYFQILRLIVLPQAFRVMIPPLTNQYLNLAKNSSLGAAVGFAELFGVARTITQSVPSVPVITIVMVIYLVISLGIAAIMNILNTRVQIKVR